MAPGAVSPQPMAAQPITAVKPQSILKRKRETPTKSLTKPESVIKRPRVAFDPGMQSNSQAGDTGKDVALIREEIAHILRRGHSDWQDDYEQIKSYFTTPLDDEDAPSSIVVQNYLLGLLSNSTLLNKSFSDLVQAVLHHPWLARDEALATAYTRFLGHLVSSQGGYLHNVLKMLVENFAHLSTSVGIPPPQSCPHISILYGRIHLAIKYVLQVVPSASNTLASVITKLFPHSDDTKRAHLRYAQNLLQLKEYAPELKSEILDLITERLIKLDVQVQTDVERLDEDMGDLLTPSNGESQPSCARMDNENDDDALSEVESVISDDDEAELDQEDERIKQLQSTVTKMDSLLELLFSSYSSSFSKGANGPGATSIFDHLLSQFHKIILPTYRSRHTQFLLFHFAQQSNELTMRLIDTCIKLIADRSRPAMLRLSSAAYLASFTARGVRISSEIVLYVFDALSAYLDRLRSEYEQSCRGPDIRKYGVYYATVQALTYIFCFRWRDLLSKKHRHNSGYTSDSEADGDEDEDVELDEILQAGGQDLLWAAGIKETFTTNFASPLNPLKICAPEVIEEFAGIAHHLNFLYIYPKLRTNRQIRLHGSMGTMIEGGILPRETSLSNLTGERHLQLDAYFPFDPYNLPLSKHWLEGDYKEYKAPPGMGGDAPQAVAGRREIDAMADDTSDEDASDTGDDDEDDDDDDGEDQRTATPSDL